MIIRHHEKEEADKSIHEGWKSSMGEQKEGVG
jgi:hypothetical protein